MNSSNASDGPGGATPTLATLEVQVAAALSRLLAACGASRLLIAWSGGRDSTALVHLASRYARTRGLDLTLVHVDHGLVADSANWAAHCLDYAGQLGLPCVVRRLVASPPAGASLEAWARERRYAALAALTDCATLVLTAHHRDDQCETVLLRVLEGAGPHGLAGMPELRRLGDGHLGRPLLACPRTMLARWVDEHGARSIEDPSNADRRFRRNRLRNEVMPGLAAAVPGVAQGLLRLARIQSAIAGGLDRLADALLENAGYQPRRIPVGVLSAAGTEWAPYVLRRALVRAGCEPPRQRQIEEILHRVCAAREDAMPVVCWGRHAVRRYRGELHITPATLPRPPDKALAWTLDTPLEIAAGTLRARPGEVCALDAGRLREGDITVRFRLGGERCRPEGSAHTRSLKHLFQHWGVPPWERPLTPLVYLDGELVAVVGYCVCAGFAVSSPSGSPGVVFEWTPRVGD